MTPQISLIVPIYNGERTLLRSLDSISHQTFSDFECILVNDGSTDGSAALLEAYAEKDNRFRVLSIPNGGVSHAKNMGLACAIGEFWAFLDCDDTLEPFALETLHRLITDTQSDIAIAHIAFENAQGKPLAQSPALPTLSQVPWCMTPSDAVTVIFDGKPFGGHLHAKLLRASAFQELRYQEDVYIYEDMLFLLEALHHSQSVAYTPRIVHHYLVTESGAFSAAFTPRKASSLLACERMLSLTSQYFPSAKDAAESFAFSNALWILEELAASPAALRRQAFAVQARKDAGRIIRQTPIPSALPFVQKVFCQAIRLGWFAFYTIHQGLYRPLKQLLR